MCFPLKNGHVLEKVTIKWGLYLENPAEIISKILEFSRSSTDIPGALVIVMQNGKIIIRFIFGKILRGSGTYY